MSPPLGSGLPFPKIRLTGHGVGVAALEKGREGLEASQCDKTQRFRFYHRSQPPLNCIITYLKYCLVKFLKTIPEAQAVFRDISPETDLSVGKQGAAYYQLTKNEWRLEAVA